MKKNNPQSVRPVGQRKRLHCRLCKKSLWSDQVGTHLGTKEKEKAWLDGKPFEHELYYKLFGYCTQLVVFFAAMNAGLFSKEAASMRAMRHYRRNLPGLL